MEKRKVIYQDGSYQLLKPKDDGNNDSWHNYGKKIRLQAINNLIKKNTFKIEMSSDLKVDLEKYQKKREIKNKQYSASKNLESKTI